MSQIKPAFAEDALFFQFEYFNAFVGAPVNAKRFPLLINQHQLQSTRVPVHFVIALNVLLLTPAL